MCMNKKDSMRYVYPLCFGEEVGNGSSTVVKS